MSQLESLMFGVLLGGHSKCKAKSLEIRVPMKERKIMKSITNIRTIKNPDSISALIYKFTINGIDDFISNIRKNFWDVPDNSAPLRGLATLECGNLGIEVNIFTRGMEGLPDDKSLNISYFVCQKNSEGKWINYDYLDKKPNVDWHNPYWEVPLEKDMFHTLVGFAKKHNIPLEDYVIPEMHQTNSLMTPPNPMDRDFSADKDILTTKDCEIIYHALISEKEYLSSLTAAFLSQTVAEELKEQKRNVEQAICKVTKILATKEENGRSAYYFTFGSDPEYPYSFGYVLVFASSWQEAIKTFKNRYPNRPGSDCVNCSFMYDAKDAKELQIELKQICHDIIWA